MRAAFLEVLNDALGSVGVIVAAIVIATTGFMRADAIAGLFIAGLIVPRAIKLMRETTSVLMEFTPADLDLDQVRRHIAELDHVVEVHDLHASTVATGLPVLTAHIVVRDDCFRDGHAVEISKQSRHALLSTSRFLFLIRLFRLRRVPSQPTSPPSRDTTSGQQKPRGRLRAC